MKKPRQGYLAKLNSYVDGYNNKSTKRSGSPSYMRLYAAYCGAR